jgi:Leucine-rich repeat (LRR) protein
LAQTRNQPLSASDIQRYEQDAATMISFLEFTFNTIGNPEIPVREKDIIINESWEKMFVDDEVQIEDDLDENRDVPLNKEVQAYLKDIDFFFRQVSFTFTIEDIEHMVNEENQLFFKITMDRHLQGITISGDTISSNRLRYVEINLDDDDKDLKIASIYTTKLNEKEELRRWWIELPEVWRNLLGERAIIKDTLRMSHVLYYNDSLAMLDYVLQRRISRDTLTIFEKDTLRISLSSEGTISAGMIDRQLLRIILIDTLNISGMKQITSLEPLVNLSKIKQLDVSHTPVDDLMPARNLTQLEYLNISFTLIDDLEPLRYLTKLRELVINNTGLRNMQPVANFVELTRLNMSNTRVESLGPVAGLSRLSDLDISGSPVNDLAPAGSLKALARFDFSETVISDISPLETLQQLYLLRFERTPVSDLRPLGKLQNLSLLFIDHTPVSSLAPLNNLPRLSNIYCDQTRVTRAEAVRFMDANPQVLVIYESAELVHWWKDMPEEWKEVFSDKVADFDNPTKEELHDVTRIRKLHVAENASLQTLDPVVNMPMITELHIQGTSIVDLTPVKYLADLRELNLSNTGVADLGPVSNLTKLSKLSFDNTSVSSVEPLMQLNELQTVYCDQSPVDTSEIVQLMIKHPDCLVVYQTGELQEWWNALPDVWQLLAENMVSPGEDPNREQLQVLANMRVVDLNASPEMARRSLEIASLDHLKKMILMEELRFTNTRVTSLEPLRGMHTLRVLISPNNPVETLEPLTEVRNLEVLDIQNTPVSRLEFLSPLDNLHRLNCAGTQIRNLKGLEYLVSLEHLDCFNTRIRNLKPVEELPQLKLVRCYNTRISQRRINKFREQRPAVEVVHY